MPVRIRRIKRLILRVLQYKYIRAPVDLQLYLDVLNLVWMISSSWRTLTSLRYAVRYRKGPPGRVIWVTLITVTLSIIIFGSLFSADCRESRDASLCRDHFYVLGIIFRKVMTKTDLPYITPETAGDLWSRNPLAPLVRADPLRPTGSGFYNNFSKNYPQGLKIVLKDAPRDSLQSALKIIC